MEILIIIAILIVCPIILGAIFEKQDKDKAEKKQREITEQAKFNMPTHNYLEKHTSQCGWALVKLANYRFAYVNGLGQYLNNEIFSYAEDFHNNIAVVRKLNCGDGIIHSSGVYIIPCEARNNLETYITKVYEGLYQYKKVYYSKPSYVDHEEIYIVKEDGTYLNKEYASKLLEIRHNYIKLQYGLKTGEIDFDGKVLSRAFIKRVDLGDGYYKVCDKNNVSWGVYDEDKDLVIIPCNYSGILFIPFCQLFVLQPFGDGKRAFPPFVVNRNNKVVISGKYDEFSILEDKYIKVSYYNVKDGVHGSMSGIVDSEGSIIVQPRYSWIIPGKHGFLVTEYGGKRCGIVKSDGYSDLEYDTFKPVFMGEKRGIEKHMSGKIYPGCDSVYDSTPTAITIALVVSKNNKYGVINFDNHAIIDIDYDKIDIIYKAHDQKYALGYIVCKDGLYGVIDLTGKIVIQANYNQIIDHIEDEDNFQESYYYDWEREQRRREEFFKDKQTYFECISPDNSVHLLTLEGKPYIQSNKTDI